MKALLIYDYFLLKTFFKVVEDVSLKQNSHFGIGEVSLICDCNNCFYFILLIIYPEKHDLLCYST